MRGGTLDVVRMRVHLSSPLLELADRLLLVLVGQVAPYSNILLDPILTVSINTL